MNSLITGRSQSLNAGTETEVANRPETIIESRLSDLGRAVTDLDQSVGDTIQRFSSVIVPCPIEATTDCTKQQPKPMQSDLANRLETLIHHANGITARLRSALANSQL